MTLYAIADPHLGHAVDKPMHIFGQQWHQHEALLAENWTQLISADDDILIPGDISWAMRLNDVIPDLRFLDQLPGRKILSRGNHDYWWQSMAKLQELCNQEGFASLKFLRNNSILLPSGDLICGTRGWILPEDPDFQAADRKIYDRELIRLEMSLQSAESIRRPEHRLVVCLHFPPFGRDGGAGDITALLDRYQADICVYGHIHGEHGRQLKKHRLNQTEYYLVSADALNFKPLRL